MGHALGNPHRVELLDILAQGAHMEQVGPEELLRRLEDGEVVLIDVRPAIESDQGRIAGAIALPVDELAARADELPPGRPVVAYCRGP